MSSLSKDPETVPVNNLQEPSGDQPDHPDSNLLPTAAHLPGLLLGVFIERVCVHHSGDELVLEQVEVPGRLMGPSAGNVPSH